MPQSRWSPFNKNLSSRYRHHATKSSFWDGKRHKIIVSILAPFIILQCLFLGLQAYIFGVGYGGENRVHNLATLAVDYDGGVIGKSLQAAYEELKGPQMLGLHWHSPSAYPDPADLYDEVFKGHYWAAIYATEGASERLSKAIGDNQTAASYQAANALGAVYNQARYPDFADADVQANLQLLTIATRLAYNELNGTKAITAIAADNTASLMAVLNPINATIYNIKEVNNGVQIFYNTVGQVFTILLQFFFLMAFNTLINDWELDSRRPVKQHVLLRILISTIYTFIGSMLVAANIYAFRGSTHLNGAQFVLLWMAYWLEMHVLFLALEIATTFLDLPWLPLFVVTFIITNVASAILPVELSPGFYKWGYALPCHEVYSLEISIMSDGANERLDIALPVLFAWWIIGIPLAYFSLVWRLNKAAEASQEVMELIKADEERASGPETEEEKKRRRELLDRVARDAEEAATGTFGLGFPAPAPYSSVRRELHEQENGV